MSDQLFAWIIYALLIVSVTSSLFGVIVRSHYLSKLIAFSMMSDVICLTIVFLGYRVIAEPPIPPIIQDGDNVSELALKSVDPLVQCLVITALVIGLASLILMSFLVIHSKAGKEGVEA